MKTHIHILCCLSVISIMILFSHSGKSWAAGGHHNGSWSWGGGAPPLFSIVSVFNVKLVCSMQCTPPPLQIRGAALDRGQRTGQSFGATPLWGHSSILYPLLVVYRGMPYNKVPSWTNSGVPPSPLVANHLRYVYSDHKKPTHNN